MSPASDRAFAIPELLEHILKYAFQVPYDGAADDKGGTPNSAQERRFLSMTAQQCLDGFRCFTVRNVSREFNNTLRSSPALRHGVLPYYLPRCINKDIVQAYQPQYKLKFDYHPFERQQLILTQTMKGPVFIFPIVLQVDALRLWQYITPRAFEEVDQPTVRVSTHGRRHRYGGLNDSWRAVNLNPLPALPLEIKVGLRTERDGDRFKLKQMELPLEKTVRLEAPGVTLGALADVLDREAWFYRQIL